MLLTVSPTLRFVSNTRVYICTERGLILQTHPSPSLPYFSTVLNFQKTYRKSRWSNFHQTVENKLREAWELRYCRAKVLQSKGTAEHRYSKLQVLQSKGTAEHRYCRAWYCRTQVQQTTGTAEHRYSKLQVLQSTGTVQHRYSKLQVLQSTGTENYRHCRAHAPQTTGTAEHSYAVRSGLLRGVEQNCANDNRKLQWWWSVAWNLGPLLISSAWNAWHYTHSSNHLNCLRFRHIQIDQQANPNV